MPQSQLVDTTLVCVTLKEPELISKTYPDYPESARRDRADGDVIIEVVVAKDGTVRDPREVQSPHPLLTKALIAAVKHWRYAPAVCDGQPIDVTLRIWSRFTLNR